MAAPRSLVGVLSMLAVLFAADLLLPDLGPSLAWAAAQSVLVFFLAALAGGWLAGRRFVLPALGVWAAVWLVVGYLLYRIAAPASDAPLAALVASNWLALVLSGAAVVAGARAGQLLSRQPPTGTRATPA